MKKQFTTLYRSWHWLMAFSTLGLLSTVLLRETLFSWRDNAHLIQTKLAELGSEITAESAKIVAKAIRAPMWEWHYIFGLVLGMSVLLYIYMVISKKIEMPIKTLLKAETNHERLKQSVYLLLLFALFFMSVTGGLMYFHDFLGISKEGAHEINELHESLLYPIIVLVVMHISGVIAHEITSKESIISKMVHGD